MPCPAASFSGAQNAATCTPWQRCEGWSLTEAIAGTSSSDRVCQVSDRIRGTGTPEDDQGTGIAVDDQGNVVIVGISNGSLAGAALGSYDAFVRKLDANGDVVWTRQFGTERADHAVAVALDGDGGIFVVGRTAGALAGPSNGEVDAFVRKYDRSGGVAWTRQFGTADWDHAYAVAVDAKGNATVAGATSDGSLGRRPLLRTYAPNGDLVRSHDLDLESTIVYGVAVDAGGSIYLAGSSSGELEGPRAGGVDAILMKLDQEGYVAWTRQYGTTDSDEALAVALDRGGNPWMVGYKNARSEVGGPRSGEGFVRKYDARGTLVFSHTIADSGWQGATGIATDGRGRGFVIGTRIASDPIRSTVSHAFVEELEAQGASQGPLRIGDDPNQASAAGVAVDSSGGVYVLVNACFSPLAGHPVVGGCDAFVAKVR